MVRRRSAGVRVVVSVVIVVLPVLTVGAVVAMVPADDAVAQASDLAGRPVGDEPSVLQKDCPLDDVGELSHLVQDRHQGQPPLPQPLEDLGQGLAAGPVDPCQRLIEDE